ncbi:hypothetical protein NSQ20_20515 [Paenibacillus sp. FSL K6-1122]|uniref:hypothetical protein n=1 Tax=Paenibacillus TaxID=44249 RepID=UPI0003E1EED2|nr:MULTISPECIES: hypothetical protein [Paenibacillus]ETT53336.1 hypothetical protein C170_07194 [Paenibacillus sp. FSL H7-689]OME98572.1 hypothetical protein BK124_15290 [Paenibacillus amylolyticus]
MNRTWKLMEEMRKVLLPVSFAQRVEYVGGGAKAMIDIPMEHPRFMIKTIRVIPSRETNVELHVLNSAGPHPEVLYFNNSQYSTGNFMEGIYDMIDLPYEDVDGTSTLHLSLKNLGTDVANFDIEVVGLTTR